MNDFWYSVKHEAGTPIIRILDETMNDEKLIEELAGVVDEIVGTELLYLLFDLTSVENIASSAIGLLAKVHAELSRRGGKLVIVLPSERQAVRRALKITRVAALVEIVETVSSGLSRLARSP